jgi:MFS family permease
LFGAAQAWEIAAVGRTLVGIGVAVTFVSLLKICANWFPADRFATLNGVTMLAGNLGAVVAGAPLAWLITVVSWRSVFVGLGLLVRSAHTPGQSCAIALSSTAMSR